MTELAHSVHKPATTYARRMSIEELLRNTKHRWYGLAVRDESSWVLEANMDSMPRTDD
jgi:hypothetical protein